MISHPPRAEGKTQVLSEMVHSDSWENPDGHRGGRAYELHKLWREGLLAPPRPQRPAYHRTSPGSEPCLQSPATVRRGRCLGSWQSLQETEEEMKMLTGGWGATLLSANGDGADLAVDGGALCSRDPLSCFNGTYF